MIELLTIWLEHSKHYVTMLNGMIQKKKVFKVKLKSLRRRLALRNKLFQKVNLQT